MLIFPGYEAVEVLVHGTWHDPEFLWFRCGAEESACLLYSGVSVPFARNEKERRFDIADSADGSDCFG